MSAVKIAAMALIIAGILGLAYGGFSYTKDTHSAKIGSLELSVQDKETVNVPVWAGVGANRCRRALAGSAQDELASVRGMRNISPTTPATTSVARPSAAISTVPGVRVAPQVFRVSSTAWARSAADHAMRRPFNNWTRNNTSATTRRTWMNAPNRVAAHQSECPQDQ